MGDNSKHRVWNMDRRSVLKTAGTGAITGIAGCLGRGGNEDGNEIHIASFPIDVEGVVAQYIEEETDILQEKMDDIGYDYEFTLSFEATPLFAAGDADMATFAALEAARFGVERDMDTVLAARMANSYSGWLYKSGTRWDPEETGGVEETIELVAEEGQHGEGGWGLGHVPTFQVIMAEAYGMSYEEGGNFEVVTTDMPAIPQLLINEEIATGVNSPAHGASGALLDDELEPLFWGHDRLVELGISLPPLTGWGMRAEFWDEHREAAEAVVEAVNEGQSWFFEEGPEEIPQSETYRDILGAENEEQAEYIVRWQLHEDVPYQTEHPPRPKDVQFTDEMIDNDYEYLEAVEDIGLLESGWEDHINLVSL